MNRNRSHPLIPDPLQLSLRNAINDEQKRIWYYRPPTKLREGNVFTSVYQSFCTQGKCACLVTGHFTGCICLVPGPFLVCVGMPGTPPPTEGTPGSGPPRRYAPLQKVHPLVLASSGGRQNGRHACYWNAFLLHVKTNTIHKNLYLIQTCS